MAIIGWLVALLLLFGGCAQLFTAKTKAHYIVVKPDGTRIEAVYESDKDQDGFRATLPDGVSVTADKSGTPEQVINATMAIHLQMLKMMDSLMQKVPTKPGINLPLSAEPASLTVLPVSRPIVQSPDPMTRTAPIPEDQPWDGCGYELSPSMNYTRVCLR